MSVRVARRTSEKASSVEKARILLLDHHPIVVRGFLSFLSEVFSHATLQQESSAAAGLERLRRSSFDLVILEPALPGRCGLDLLREIKTAWPHVPILVFSDWPEEQFALRALRLGAAGYLPKEAPLPELITAVRRGLAGGKYIRPSVAEQLASQLGSEYHELPHEALSHREFQILRYIGAGKAPKQIASELSLSIKTVSTYRGRLLEKLSMHNNAELTQYAICQHLVPRARFAQSLAGSRPGRELSSVRMR